MKKLKDIGGKIIWIGFFVFLFGILPMLSLSEYGAAGVSVGLLFGVIALWILFTL